MGRVIHFEIIADDADRTIKFYESVFGWKVQKWDGPIDYWLITTGDEKEPGIDGAFGMRQSKEDTTVNSIDIKSVDETVKKIEENGGEIVRPKMAVPGVGYMIYFKDTEGNLWGAMESDTSAK
ncbi:MAG: VOC family protein [Candidatus Thorarchaeota archaeon]|jgi:predicted enzyme related to lactoylglutathione lyase